MYNITIYILFHLVGKSSQPQLVDSQVTFHILILEYVKQRIVIFLNIVLLIPHNN